MALFQVVSEYSSQGGQGGTCAFCNASKRVGIRPEQIITTNLEVDYDAPPGVWPVKWLEMCETCVTEMAHLLGMQTQDEVEGLNHTIQFLLNENDDYKEQLEANIKLVDALTYVKENAPQPVPKTQFVASQRK